MSGQPALTSRTVQLRPLLPSDAEWCYALMCGPAGERWKYRGRTPPPDLVAADLWRGVFAQFVVIEKRSGRRAGLVGFYNVSVDAHRAYAFALAEPDAATSVTEGFGLLCHWGFDHHGFDRLYLEVAEFNLVNFASLGDAAIVEGRLRNYELWKGRLWDLFILSLTPESFATRFDELLERRRAHIQHRDDPTGEEFAALVTEVWPLDSLALVETLDALEEAVGREVDAAMLAGIDAESPQQWAQRALELARGTGQPGGSSFNPPGWPSGPAASTRRPDESSMTTSGSDPLSHSTT